MCIDELEDWRKAAQTERPMSVAERGKTERKARYIVKPNEPPSRGTEAYSHVVWDTKYSRPVAYTSAFTAVDYAGQMNEKGFIEP